ISSSSEGPCPFDDIRRCPFVRASIAGRSVMRGGACLPQAFRLICTPEFYTGRSDLDWVRRRARVDKADKAHADEEEQGEGHPQDERAVGVRAGGDEARRR